MGARVYNKNSLRFSQLRGERAPGAPARVRARMRGAPAKNPVSVCGRGLLPPIDPKIHPNRPRKQETKHERNNLAARSVLTWHSQGQVYWAKNTQNPTGRRAPQASLKPGAGGAGRQERGGGGGEGHKGNKKPFIAYAHTPVNAKTKTHIRSDPVFAGEHPGAAAAAAVPVRATGPAAAGVVLASSESGWGAGWAGIAVDLGSRITADI
jgi:hypothetical protein